MVETFNHTKKLFYASAPFANRQPLPCYPKITNTSTTTTAETSGELISVVDVPCKLFTNQVRSLSYEPSEIQEVAEGPKEFTRWRRNPFAALPTKYAPPYHRRNGLLRRGVSHLGTATFKTRDLGTRIGMQGS